MEKYLLGIEVLYRLILSGLVNFIIQAELSIGALIFIPYILGIVWALSPALIYLSKTKVGE